MKRLFDFFSSLAALIILSPLLLLTCVLVRATSRGPVFNVSDRIGVKNNIFRMYKFRTMNINTPNVATHLLEDPDSCLTPIGRLLRKTSIDELPQLFNILKGEMSFVGPRPALFNQDDLIELRTKKQVHNLTPGLTGWAQINGRDEIIISAKVDYDEYYLRNRSFALDLKIISKTVLSVIKSDNITH